MKIKVAMEINVLREKEFVTSELFLGKYATRLSADGVGNREG